MRMRRSGDSSRTPLTASWAPLPGVGEPQGLRRLVEGDLLRLDEVAETTAVRRCAVRAPVRGSGGCPPGRPLLRQRRERPGVRRGEQHPIASPSV